MPTDQGTQEEREARLQAELVSGDRARVVAAILEVHGRCWDGMVSLLTEVRTAQRDLLIHVLGSEALRVEDAEDLLRVMRRMDVVSAEAGKMLHQVMATHFLAKVPNVLRALLSRGSCQADSAPAAQRVVCAEPAGAPGPGTGGLPPIHVHPPVYIQEVDPRRGTITVSDAPPPKRAVAQQGAREAAAPRKQVHEPTLVVPRAPYWPPTIGGVWGKLTHSKFAHFFVDGHERSACGHWLKLGIVLPAEPPTVETACGKCWTRVYKP